jgi:protein ImuA
VRARDLRRLQLIAQRHRAPAFLFRGLAAAREASPAELRLLFEPQPGGARLQLFKSRGGHREPFELQWPVPHRSAGEVPHGAA